MDNNKFSEGVSVKEIENFAKKHRVEVVFCLALVLACFFSFFMFGTGWSLFFASVGGILGMVFPQKVESIFRSIKNFVQKQESTTQLILAIVYLLLAIFIPPLVFLKLGSHAGINVYRFFKNSDFQVK